MRAMAMGLVGLGLCGCTGTGPGTDCTAIAVGSVNLTVVDPSGAAVDGASATYSVDGGAPSDCEPFPGGGFVCGWEVDGAFSVTASAPGHHDATGEVNVGADECHVIPESLELVLEPIACTSEEVVSVVATVASATGGDLTGVAVQWSADGGATFAPCRAEGADWRCAEEVAGTLTIEASADGHQVGRVDVEVAADECHVVTESVVLTLDPL